MSSILDALKKERPEFQSKLPETAPPGGRDPFAKTDEVAPGDDLWVPGEEQSPPSESVRLPFPTTVTSVLVWAILACVLGVGVGFAPQLGRVSADVDIAHLDEPAVVAPEAEAELATVLRNEGELIQTELAASPVLSAAIELAAMTPLDEIAAALTPEPAKLESVEPAAGDAEAETQTEPAKPMMVQVTFRKPPPVEPLVEEQVVPLRTDIRPVPEEVAGYQPIREVLYEAEPQPQYHRIIPVDSVPAKTYSPARKPEKTPATKPASARRSYKVEGIFWEETRPMALIDGEIVEIGDHVAGGAEVLEIQRTSIVIEENGVKRTLHP